MNIPESLLNNVYKKSSSFIKNGTSSYEHKIVDYFVENGNNNQDILGIMQGLNIPLEEKDAVIKAIEKMCDEGALLYIHKINNNARTIKEKTMMTTYYLDDQVIKVYMALTDIAITENSYNKTVKTNEIIDFNDKLSLFVETLDSIYQSSSVDIKLLKTKDSSLYEELFEDDCLYNRIRKGILGFNHTVSKLKNDIDIIEENQDIFDLLDNYRIGVDEVFSFIRDFLKDLPPYLSSIESLFERLSVIHETYDIDKFYKPAHEAVSVIGKVGIKEEDGIKSIYKRIDNIIKAELKKEGKVLVLGDEMRNITKGLREVTNKIIKFQTIKRHQRKFQQMAKKFYEIDNKNELKLAFDYYFSTDLVEHFSINGDYSIKNDVINYELSPSRKYKPVKREVVRRGLSEEEIKKKKEVDKRKKEEKIEKGLFIKKLFPNGTLRKDTLFSSEEINFIMTIYFRATADAHCRKVNYNFRKTMYVNGYEDYVFKFSHKKGGKTVWESENKETTLLHTIDIGVVNRDEYQKRNK